MHDKEYLKLIDEGILTYIRSGIQVRRKGLIYSALTWVERKTHSAILYYVLNKDCIISEKELKENRNRKILMSAAVTGGTTFRQLNYFLDHMRDRDSIIFMFHSILPDTDRETVQGTWRWSEKNFERLCSFLSNERSCNVCTTGDLIKEVL